MSVGASVFFLSLRTTVISCDRPSFDFASLCEGDHEKSRAATGVVAVDCRKRKRISHKKRTKHASIYRVCVSTRLLTRGLSRCQTHCKVWLLLTSSLQTAKFRKSKDFSRLRGVGQIDVATADSLLLRRPVVADQEAVAAWSASRARRRFGSVVQMASQVNSRRDKEKKDSCVRVCANTNE